MDDYVICERCGLEVEYEHYEQHCMMCNDTNVLEDYITQNSQIHRSNVREFLREHHSPPGDSGLMRRYEEHVSRHYDISEYESNLAIAERIGKVDVGVSVDRVSKIYTEDMDGIIVGNCAICQESFEQKKGALRKLNCGHYFFAKCIEKWLKRNTKCPLCMQVLE